MGAQSHTQRHGGHGNHGSHGGHGSMRRLMTGFGLAVLLTIVPFALVMGEVELPRLWTIGLIMGFGAAQILVHLVFFLHLDSDGEGGWTLAATAFAAVILVIVLAGSLWVMHNMNANMMPMPSGMDMQMDMQGEAALPMEMPQGTTMQGGSGHSMDHGTDHGADHGADHGTGMQMLGPDGKPMQMNP